MLALIAYNYYAIFSLSVSFCSHPIDGLLAFVVTAAPVPAILVTVCVKFSCTVTNLDFNRVLVEQLELGFINVKLLCLKNFSDQNKFQAIKIDQIAYVLVRFQMHFLDHI